MKDVSVNDGRTVLFVSHNMGAIKSLCDVGIWMANGTLSSKGDIDGLISDYLQQVNFSSIKIGKVSNRSGSGSIIFDDFQILNSLGNISETVFSGEDISLVFHLKAFKSCSNVSIGFSIHDETDDMLSVLYSEYQGFKYSFEEGTHVVKFSINANNLSSGKYYIRGLILENGLEADWPKEPLGSVNVEPGDYYSTGHLGHQSSRIKFLIKGQWQ